MYKLWFSMFTCSLHSATINAEGMVCTLRASTRNVLVDPAKGTFRCTSCSSAGANGVRLEGRQVVRRQDFVITNKRDQRLQCSYWQMEGAGHTGRLPGVIYCHCNSGSRLDAVEAIRSVVPLGVRVFALDFSVCKPSSAMLL
jgi:hypothetical protein